MRKSGTNFQLGAIALRHQLLLPLSEWCQHLLGPNIPHNYQSSFFQLLPSHPSCWRIVHDTDHFPCGRVLWDHHEGQYAFLQGYKEHDLHAYAPHVTKNSAHVSRILAEQQRSRWGRRHCWHMPGSANDRILPELESESSVNIHQSQCLLKYWINIKKK